MSLQAKFALMLGMLGLTVVLALVGGLLSLNFMHEEVRTPFQSMSGALLQLERIKVSVERQRHILTRAHDDAEVDEPAAARRAQRAAMASRLDSPEGLTPRPASERDRAEMFDCRSAMQTALDELARDEWSRMVTGGTTLANLRDRLSAARDRADAWLQDGDHDAREHAAAMLLGAFDLVRRTESRVVRETHELLAHATDIRARLRNVAAFIMLIAVLTCALGVMLVRRWVLRPVADLRTAATRIAAGDFAHRVAVRGGDELAALSSEVNAMAGMVKDLQDRAVDRERLAAVGEMVQRIAHNLRSPLGGIRVLAEMSRSELRSATVPPSLKADMDENQSRIIEAVDRFEAWLRDLLDATRPTKISPVNSDPRAWLERVVKAYLPAAQARGASIRVVQTHAPASAVFDEGHMELALGALIANALDAAADNARPDRPPMVNISSDITREPGQHGEFWEVSVADSGPGVSSELRERIFEPYFTTKKEGTGIGLALARQIVRSHGGELFLASPPQQGNVGKKRSADGSGAKFVVRVPLNIGSMGQNGVAKAGHSEAVRGQNSGH
ncbi:MAG: HAMP domain-containing histidine kinase [Phycisphaeraceae bacterium]|nr:HAMP domain-containing histidine kinase [Phycisphaeraceae bacterium]MBX3405969.1 HAMP domain-containing histidine kinase [Phycisphaeraceae bacterium]